MWWGPSVILALLSRLTDTLIKKLTHGLGLQVHLLQCLKGTDLKVLGFKGPKYGFKRKVRPEK